MSGKKWGCLFVFVAMNAWKLNAQWSDTLYRIFHGHIYPTASFDSRNSFISARRAHIWGIKAGVEFDSRLQFGAGYNFLDDRMTRAVQYTDAGGNIKITTGELHLAYVSLHTRFVYYRKGKWKFTVIPVQVGFGSASYHYVGESGSGVKDRGFICTYEPGFSISYKVLPFIGAGMDLGYRLMLKSNPAIPEKFTSPVYSFYFVIYWADIYKALFPDSKWAAKM